MKLLAKISLIAVSSVGVAISPPATQTRTVKPIGIDHVALLTPNIERYIEFYRDFLGFPEMQRGNEVPNAPNVYYWHDGSPENLAKEKLGRLFMIKLWVGDHQAIEFFPSNAPIAPGKKQHHLGIGFADQEAVRQALVAAKAQAPAQPGPGLFFTYDRNISATEVIEQKPRPRVIKTAANATPADQAISTHLLFAEIPGENSADLRRFYIETLGYRPTSETRFDIGPDGDHIILKNAEKPSLCIGFEVKSLDSALDYLQKRPWRRNYPHSLKIERIDGQRGIQLIDPEGVRVVLRQVN